MTSNVYFSAGALIATVFCIAALELRDEEPFIQALTPRQFVLVLAALTALLLAVWPLVLLWLIAGMVRNRMGS